MPNTRALKPYLIKNVKLPSDVLMLQDNTDIDHQDIIVIASKPSDIPYILDGAGIFSAPVINASNKARIAPITLVAKLITTGVEIDHKNKDTGGGCYIYAVGSRHHGRVNIVHIDKKGAYEVVGGIDRA